MSFGLHVYLIDLNKAHALMGQCDDDILQAVAEGHKEQIAQADQWNHDDIAEGMPSRYEALHAVLNGGPFTEQYAAQYLYAYEMLCNGFGQFLDNRCFSPFSGSWLERVDAGFQQLGMSIRVSDLAYRGAPRPLPMILDCPPGYGEWTAQECQKGLAQWNSVTAEQRAALDPEVLEGLENCVEWMSESVASRQFGIAAFLH